MKPALDVTGFQFIGLNCLFNQSHLNNFIMSCKNEEVNYEVEYFSEQFQMYAAAVKMAALASNGSGELNEYDHVAKDLYKTGFDEVFEQTANWLLNAFMAEHEETIENLVDERYNQ